MADVSGRKLDLRIEGIDRGDDPIPAAIIVQILVGMQHTLQLFAMNREHRELRPRARIPVDIQRRYVLECSAPRTGSFLIAARLGATDEALFDTQATQAVVEDFSQFVRALTAGDPQALTRLVPDGALRRRIAESMRLMAPKSGSRWRLSVEPDGGERVVIGEEILARAREILRRDSDDTSVQTVTGRLDAIDFGARKVTIIYRPTQRQLDCYYDEAIEELLLENPRELIHVTGRVALDDDGHPTRITDVDEIREVDMSPFDVHELRIPDRTLHFRETLVLTPEMDESEQLLWLRHESLGIDVCAPTREDLDRALMDEFDVLWRNYVDAPQGSPMTIEAKALAQRLRDAVREEAHAA